MDRFCKEKRIIVASNRLPFYKDTDEKGKTVWRQAAGGLVSALDPVLRKTNGIWIGWEGAPSDNTHEPMKLLDSRELNLAEETHTSNKGHYYIGNVPLSESEVNDYYTLFSNGTLWSLFHYFFEKTNIDDATWKAYYNVNKRFASYIAEVSEEHDVIWIQDFHLFLVPYFLRKLKPDAKIHFFLHIPFPHIDIFSILPWKDMILQSLLCCNTIGFHHEQYRKNLLEAVDRYQQKNPGDSHIINNFYVNAISIDFDRINNYAQRETVIAKKQEILNSINSEKLIVGVDRMDYSKGIKQRLLGINNLLENHPELAGKFCYYQLAVPSREDVKDYQLLKREIDETIGRINGKFSTETWSPIHYIYRSVNFEELVALYSAADIALVTPLRDGMNLVCKEYVASHTDEDGVLILSKFAGAISEFSKCIAVNPYSAEDIAGAIYKAIHMPPNERQRRMRAMRQVVEKHNINHWLEKCFSLF